MTRRLWFDPSFGASGDMLLGALVALCEPDEPDVAERLVEELGRLDVEGWAINRSAVSRCGLAATRIGVSAEPSEARRWSSIDASLAAADLSPAVAEGSRRTFRLLAEVEAAQHGVEVDDVHFHEVGAVDAIVDIVGTWWLLDRLDADEIVAGPVGLGHGTVSTAHGLLPLPAPATLELLRGAPVRALDAPFETCTPTGAALLRSIASWGPIPDGRVVATGRGAGGKDPVTHPNVVTAVLIDSAPFGDDHRAESAVVLATNVDDVSPEVLGHVVDVLLRAGADDAWIAPILMKKGRPAHQVCALVAAAEADAVRAALSAETGTLGVRSTVATKHIAPRRVDTVDVLGFGVRIKVGPHGAKPEHDDLVDAAARLGIPVRVLATEAINSWMRADENRRTAE